MQHFVIFTDMDWSHDKAFILQQVYYNYGWHHHQESHKSHVNVTMKARSPQRGLRHSTYYTSEDATKIGNKKTNLQPLKEYIFLLIQQAAHFLFSFWLLRNSFQ